MSLRFRFDSYNVYSFYQSDSFLLEVEQQHDRASSSLLTYQCGRTGARLGRIMIEPITWRVKAPPRNGTFCLMVTAPSRYLRVAAPLRSTASKDHDCDAEAWPAMMKSMHDVRLASRVNLRGKLVAGIAKYYLTLSSLVFSPIYPARALCTLLHLRCPPPLLFPTPSYTPTTR